MAELSGKVVVVAGGGRGIGKAIAVKLASYGAKLVIGGRTKTEIQGVVEDIVSMGGEAISVSLDVTHQQQVDDFIETAVNAYGRIDSLVYCSGVNNRMPAEFYPEDAWTKVIDTNLTGAYRICRSVFETMKHKGGGSIVTITSMMSHVVTPNQSAYAASKAALLQYTRLLAVEWAKFNIRVNAVSPGYIETEMTADIMRNPEFRDAVIAKTPQSRFGAPEEIAEAVCFLASSKASFITGACLPVDGGFLAGHPQIIPS